LGRISAKILHCWNFCRISALVKFLQNFCVGGISAEFLHWWNFCRYSELVEFLQNFYFILQKICRNFTNTKILQKFYLILPILKSLLPKKYFKITKIFRWINLGKILFLKLPIILKFSYFYYFYLMIIIDIIIYFSYKIYERNI
jgi:hypothetical protein